MTLTVGDLAALSTIFCALAALGMFVNRVVIENAIEEKLKRYATREDVKALELIVGEHYAEHRQKIHGLANEQQADRLVVAKHDMRIAALEKERQ